jgi:hypothetical protein
VTHYAIARRDVGDLRADLKDNRPGLMAQQMRKKLVRTFDTVDLADLRSANARGMNLHEHLPALERRHFDFIDDQRLALFDQNGSRRFHSK